MKISIVKADTPSCIEIGAHSIKIAVCALVILIGSPVSVLASLKYITPSRDAEWLIGMSAFALGFLLAFLGFLSDLISPGPVSRNVAAMGLLLMSSAFPASLCLLLVFGRPILWAPLLMYSVVLVVRGQRLRETA